MLFSPNPEKVRLGVKRMKQKNIVADPNGSYTGRPRHPDETPVQDADDL